MWQANVSITNNTDFKITFNNPFISEQVILAYESYVWDTTNSPNTTSLKFWITEGGQVEFQGGLTFGVDCGVWVDRGYMENPIVIMDCQDNDFFVTQESNGGITIVENFDKGGNISLTFKNKIFSQEFKLG